MQYSPKLKNAMEEIKKILHKHDIAGAIALHTYGNGEYYINLSPSYSCAKLEGDKLHIKAKKSDYKTLEAWQEVVRSTSNMLSVLSETTLELSANLNLASDIMDDMVQAEHSSGGHTTHTQQNN